MLIFTKLRSNKAHFKWMFVIVLTIPFQIILFSSSLGSCTQTEIIVFTYTYKHIILTEDNLSLSKICYLFMKATSATVLIDHNYRLTLQGNLCNFSPKTWDFSWVLPQCQPAEGWQRYPCFVHGLLYLPEAFPRFLRLWRKGWGGGHWLRWRTKAPKRCCRWNSGSLESYLQARPGTLWEKNLGGKGSLIIVSWMWKCL